MQNLSDFWTTSERLTRLFAALLIFCALGPFASPAWADSQELTPVVAVLPFEEGQQVAQGLGRQFADTILTDLHGTGSLRCVERSRMDDIAKELQFQLSGLVDDSTACRLGQMHGATWIVTGSIQQSGGAYRANIRVIDTETAEVLLAARTTQSDPFLLQDATSRRILRALLMNLGGEVQLRTSLLRRHSTDSAVTALVIDPTSTWLAYGTSQGEVWLGPLQGEGIPQRLGKVPKRVEALAFDPDGKVLAAAGSKGIVQLWRRADGAALATLKDHEDGALSLAFSDDGRQLAVGTGYYQIHLWQVPEGILLERMEIHQKVKSARKRVHSLAFGGDGQSLISAGTDLTVRFWSLANTARPKRQLVEDLPRGELLTAAISPRRTMLALSLKDIAIDLRRSIRTDTEYVKLVNAVSGEEIRRYEGHEEAITALNFGPDQRLLASASLDQRVKIWDTARALELVNLNAGAPVLAVAFSLDGRHLVAGTEDGALTVWRVE